MKQHYIPKLKDKVFYVNKYSLDIIPTTVSRINTWNKKLSIDLKVEEFLIYGSVTEDYYQDYAEAYLRLKHYTNLEKTKLAKEFYEKMLELDKKLEI